MRSLFLILTLCLFAVFANAQLDSVYMNAGKIKLRKSFTQSTVIKASDLEKIPITNISEAIRLWTNGFNAGKNSVYYMIDGIMMQDVDAYNILDIEEIVIVQNALAQYNSSNSQLLAIVTTKKNKSKAPAFNFSSQVFGVTKKVDDYKTTPGVFHQYYLSGSGGVGKVRFGGSANYVHDMMPVRKNDDSNYISTKPNIDRIRLTGWVQADLGEKNRLTIQANYTPQYYGYEDTVLTPFQSFNTSKEKFNETLINSMLHLRSNFSSFRNDFSFTLVSNKQNGDEDRYYYYFPSYTSYTGLFVEKYRMKFLIFNINDNISYTWQLKEWLIEPAVDIAFQNLDYDYYKGVIGGTSESWKRNDAKWKRLTVTPSVAVYYKNIFNVQGGFLKDATKIVKNSYRKKKIYPFVSVAANVLPEKAKVNWKIYGSYGKSFLSHELINMLNDFNYNIYPKNIIASNDADLKSSFFNYVVEAQEQYNNRYHAGTVLSLLQNKLSISYNYLQAENFLMVPYHPFPSVDDMYVPAKNTMQNNQVAINSVIANNKKFEWRQGLYINFLNNRIQPDKSSYRGTENYHMDRSIWGGWTNRFSYKNISLGFDILYSIEKKKEEYFVEKEKHNSLLLQHAFIGYTITCKNDKNIDIYISARNLADSYVQPLAADRRKYFGAGLKVGF